MAERSAGVNEEFVLPPLPNDPSDLDDRKSVVDRRTDLSSPKNDPPESPDMKFARTRLGHLLDGIRNGEIQTTVQTRTRVHSPEDFERDLLGRTKKSLRRERMIFELRGKPFALQDTGRIDDIYTLCRNWMRGSDEERGREKREVKHPEPSDDSLDLLATKEIWALPRPRNRIRIEPAPPPLYMAYSKNPDVSSVDGILDEYKPHWKKIRKNWHDYSKIRDKQYEKSINLIETVHAIARQSLM